MVYVSDHGENLFDNNNLGFGRGFVEPSPALYHVPFFIWYSKGYRNFNKDKCYNFEKNKNAKLTLENFGISMMDLSNFILDDSLAARSFFNHNLVTRSRMVNIKNYAVNYDIYFKRIEK
jgi:glucan phosphoethanolaminetransferase (alkaline phosphatase superfamily)